MQSGYLAAFPSAGAHSLIDSTRKKFRVDFMRTAGTVVLQLIGQLDETTTCQLEKEVLYWLNRGEKTLVLDMESVELVRRAGARCILMMGNLLDLAGCKLALSGLYGPVGLFLRMHGVAGMFETFENIEELENQTRSRVTH
jgi:anti-anti-sigma factor